MKLKAAKPCLETAKQVLRFWDPIGVIGRADENGSADDEYDSYAPGLISLLERGANPQGVCDHFVKLRVSSMGLGAKPPTDKEQFIAQRLVAWRDSGYLVIPDFSSR